MNELFDFWSGARGGRKVKVWKYRIRAIYFLVMHFLPFDMRWGCG